MQRGVRSIVASVRARTEQPVTNSPEEPDVAGLDLTVDQRTSHYVDMWKQSVETQQHFNNIEWQIRGLALTVATFALGASGWVAKDGNTIGPISLGAVAALAGLVLWYAFYFVDRYWYHPLLKAAVEHGSIIEDEIKRDLPQAGMTRTITARSAYKPRGLVRWLSGTKKGHEMHSDDKLAWFYKICLLYTSTGGGDHDGLGGDPLTQPDVEVGGIQPQVVVPAVVLVEAAGKEHRHVLVDLGTDP